MSSSDYAGNGSNQAAGVDAQRPPISPAGSGTHNQDSSSPDTISGETGRLLDIDGLLKIARLIEKIMKEGRINTEGERHPGPTGGSV